MVTLPQGGEAASRSTSARRSGPSAGGGGHSSCSPRVQHGTLTGTSTSPSSKSQAAGCRVSGVVTLDGKRAARGRRFTLPWRSGSTSAGTSFPGLPLRTAIGAHGRRRAVFADLRRHGFRYVPGGRTGPRSSRSWTRRGRTRSPPPGAANRRTRSIAVEGANRQFDVAGKSGKWAIAGEPVCRASPESVGNGFAPRPRSRRK